jgi:hypothetical protein
MSRKASFLRSKVRQNIIGEKSKIYKNSKCFGNQKSLNYLQKKYLIMRIGGKMHYLQSIT